jgi:hypothetical protein
MSITLICELLCVYSAVLGCEVNLQFACLHLQLLQIPGATQACGTGACAVVVAAVKEGRSERVRTSC